MNNKLSEIIRQIIINESPDNVEVGDYSLVWTDDSAYAFGFEYDEVYVAPDTHDYIHTYYEDDERVDTAIIPRKRERFEYPGRLWLNEKIISFWEYPESKYILKDLLRELKREMNSKYDLNVNFNNSWRIEVLKNPDIEFHGSSDMEWSNVDYKSDYAGLVNINNYDAPEDIEWSDAGEDHVKSPGEKASGKDYYNYGKALGKKDVEKRRAKEKEKTTKFGDRGDQYEPSQKIKRFREIIRQSIHELSSSSGEKRQLNETFDSTLGPNKLMGMLMGRNNNKKTEPEHYRPPEVDPYDPKFKVGLSFEESFSINEDFDGHPNKVSASAKLNIKLSKIKNLVEFSHRWEAKESGWWYGEYPLYEDQVEDDDDVCSWQSILEQIASNGVGEPLKIIIEDDGRYSVLTEYAIAAYDLLGIPEIPVKVEWRGGVEGSEQDLLSEYYSRLKLPRNAESLDQYFDHAKGFNFSSDRHRVNWVADNSEMPISPKQALKTGNYETGNI